MSAGRATRSGSLQFVDTNVLVYGADVTAATKRDMAASLLERLWSSGDGQLSVQVLQELFVALTRKVRPALTDAEARAITGQYAHWRVHRPGSHDVLAAIAIHERYGISFWDAMVVRSAAQTGCGVLWSEDLNDGSAYEGVLVRNPFAL